MYTIVIYHGIVHMNGQTAWCSFSNKKLFTYVLYEIGRDILKIKLNFYVKIKLNFYVKIHSPETLHFYNIWNYHAPMCIEQGVMVTRCNVNKV